MKRLLLVLALLGAIALAQTGHDGIQRMTTAPSGACGNATLALDTVGKAFYICDLTTLTWQAIPVVSGSVITSGLITLVASGSCPTGWTEVTALNGKFLQGTVAANGDVGTTGGNATITPAGTNSTAAFTPAGTVAAPVFTGSSATSSAVSAGTPAGTNTAPVFTGSLATASATTAAPKLVTANTSTGVAPQITATGTVAAPVFTGAALSTHTHTLTATGTNSAPAFTGSAGTVPAETFTGAAIDPRPAFVKVIFCSKN